MIDSQHKEYSTRIDKWLLVDDITNGENLDDYLITLNPQDTSTDNKTRNEQHKERAVFYDIAPYTLKGLVSLPFNKDITIETPQNLEYLIDNVDGSGLTIEQHSKTTLTEVIKKGRSGLFVTFPPIDGGISLADKDKYFATINQIDAQQIINWHTRQIGSRSVVDLVVIKDKYIDFENYEEKEIDQITELYLDDANVYNVRKWLKDEDSGEYRVFEETIPKQANGQTFDIIPFVFVGSEYNSYWVNDTPLYNLCKQNIAHYRNSADLESSTFFAGQNQPWMSGISQSAIDLMKENNMYVGSGTLIGVPSGEKFDFAKPDANPLVREVMTDKIDLMIGTGARFIKESGKIKTATESANDAKVHHSLLASMVNNVNDAYLTAFEYISMYMGNTEEIDFKISTDFITPETSAQDLQAMVASFVQGAIPIADYHRWLKQRDLTDPEKTLEDFSEEINTTESMTDEPIS